MFRVIAFVCLVAFASPALAHDDDRGVAASTASAAAVSDTIHDDAPLPPWVTSAQQKRPAALSALYGSYGALAVADVVTTKKAIAGRAAESNPLMGSGSTTRMVLVKAAGASMSIYFAERMWKKNRIGAIVTAAALNGISAAVVARNARLARR